MVKLKIVDLCPMSKGWYYMKVNTRLADLNICIESEYKQIEEFCYDYRINDDIFDIGIKICPEDIEFERTRISISNYSDDGLALLAVQRKIAEKIIFYQRILMHCAAISFDNKAYLFTAVSGTGKSTHIGLWKQFLGNEVQVINGDKPFIWVKEDVSLVYGSPWAGKEKMHCNISAPVSGICLISRGTENRICRIRPDEYLIKMMQQVYFPREAEAAGLLLELYDQLLKSVPLYYLECDISEAAVKTSFEAMTGNNYYEYKI